MRRMKQGLAVLMSVLLLMPSLPVNAAEAASAGSAEEQKTVGETQGGGGGEITFNTGEQAYIAGFEEDGSCSIRIPEKNPFFPYEVQFTHDGETVNKWFMTPDDTVEIGGHTFRVETDFDGSAVTQMSLKVAGDTVIVYPEEKEFSSGAPVPQKKAEGTVSGNVADTVSGNVPDMENGQGETENSANTPSVMSLLPLTERSLRVDLTGYTPAELTQVSLSSVFTGTNALTATDKVMWTYNDDDYTISSSGDKIDLSWNTYYAGSQRWEMIVGDDDQLAAQNIRYMVSVETTETKSWLLPQVYRQDESGKRTGVKVVRGEYYDSYYSKDSIGRRLEITVPDSELAHKEGAYLGLSVNPDVFADVNFSQLKVYEGKFATAAEAVGGKDITSQICCTDMTQPGAGYLLSAESYSYGYLSQWVTILTFDENGNTTGCLPFEIRVYRNGNSIGFSMYQNTDTGKVSVDNNRTYVMQDGCEHITVSLYQGYPANGTYALDMSYYKMGTESSSSVTAAYIGQYTSIAEAQAAGAQDIKDTLFGSGYEADYSKGVYTTVFVGADGTTDQEIYKYCFQTKEGEGEKPVLSGSTMVRFSGLVDASGKRIPCYIVDTQEDSYAEYNYLTILVNKDVDLTKLAPTFWTDSGINLYAAGSKTQEISGVSEHDFSNGPVQYTASAENGKNAKNYWLQVVQATDGAGWLYINSLKDPEAQTKTEGGVTYSTREMLIDGYHDYVHDIFLANMGTDSIPALGVELTSDTVELDSYWTLSGNYDLSGCGAIQSYQDELPNLAKIRIRKKAGVQDGTDISGTLTIKSGGTVLTVLTLTGTVGDPGIITKEIPEAVKYVPYGTMIQNSNKYYSWNRVSYEMIDGKLPGGMVVKPNGEIYGVPTAVGEFTFTVRMDNSYSDFSDSERTYTLIVNENTDPNVEGATDTGYELTQRIQNITLDSSTDQTMVSEGVYGEFVDIFLDGNKLREGVDYTSESGSTRITISSQTLKASNIGGTHTLGIEFRTEDDILKRAAQNYIVDDGNGGSGNGDSDDGSSSGGNGGSSHGGGSSGSDSSGSAGTANMASSGKVTGVGAAIMDGRTHTVSYTVQEGDTLWKIAEKHYGSGAYWEKIFKDNAAVISDPDKIYAGQVLTLYLTPENGEAIEGGGSYYTVEEGDTLWKIAKKLYGRGWRWRKIYQANTDRISDPGNIYAGQVLIIPE